MGQIFQLVVAVFVLYLCYSSPEVFRLLAAVFIFRIFYATELIIIILKRIRKTQKK